MSVFVVSVVTVSYSEPSHQKIPKLNPKCMLFVTQLVVANVQQLNTLVLRENRGVHESEMMNIISIRISSILDIIGPTYVSIRKWKTIVRMDYG